MNKYTIYCTGEQTRRALELGAPIETMPYFPQVKYEVRNFYVSNEISYIYPTAEQMIGWLEEQGVCFTIQSKQKDDGIKYGFVARPINETTFISIGSSLSSRKEATLAAIDAALDYLSKSKEE